MEGGVINKEMREEKGGDIGFVKRNPLRARAVSAAPYREMLCGDEGLFWLDSGKLGQLLPEPKICVNTQWGASETLLSDVRPSFAFGGVKAEWGDGGKGESARVNLLALGDVGGTVLTGLKLLGGDVISEIGICDIDEKVCRRWEYEMNQTAYPWDYGVLPPVKIVEREALFDCDVFVFCASKGVPPVGAEAGDVRMAQFEANRRIVADYAKMARQTGFSGLFAVVSDPVEPLCREAFLQSNRQETGNFDGKGLRPEQIQGYGLGVMNGRAAYYAGKDSRFASFLTEGRAYGPHGKDLVIANSIKGYDDKLSRELTRLAAAANLRTREMGFKPYIAPALSSAAIPILLTLRGSWHYSSVFLGGVYMGCKNRFGRYGLETEALPLPELLYNRLRYAYEQLDRII